jgi:hypothetical protein
VGFHFVIQALCEGGRSDVIYDILANPDPPSYAAQVAHGATTLTEAWDANPNSSQNHFMLGHAEEWFYRYLAGIDVDFSRRPEERIVLRPTPVGDIDSAQAQYKTPLGRFPSIGSAAGVGSSATLRCRQERQPGFCCRGNEGNRSDLAATTSRSRRAERSPIGNSFGGACV